MQMPLITDPFQSLNHHECNMFRIQRLPLYNFALTFPLSSANASA